MNTKRALLIIFVKNPRLGKVKTRLAQSVGDEKALKIYRFLLVHTAQVSAKLDVDKVVYYTEVIEEDDFEAKYFDKQLQVQSPDLGERMYEAFERAFAQNYEKVVIIGSDCYALDTPMLQEAFRELDEHDAVVGPANDGGYYLLGLSRPNEAVFRNKTWSTPSVLPDTLKDFETQGWTCTQLPMLTDIDYLSDMPTDLRERFDV